MWWVDNWRPLLSSWARDIVVVVGLAAVVEMIMPRGNFRRFGQLVMGLFVLLAIAKPLLAVTGVAVHAPGGSYRVVREGSAYVFAPDRDSGRPAAATGADLVETTLRNQLAGSVALALGMAERDVNVSVWLSGSSADWPSRPRRIEIRLLRWPRGWTAQPAAGGDGGSAGGAGTGGAGTGGASLGDQGAAAAESLLSQIAAIYRLDREQVKLILPR
jgi:hypothetical protein